jgi:DNA repair protein RadD
MYEPRWYQNDAVDSLFEYFDTHGGTAPDGTIIRANPLVGMPTGTGKSLSIAMFNQRALRMYPQTRIVAATHVKELIAGNAKTMLNLDPSASVGIYSSGLNEKNHYPSIIYGGIQSMVKKAELFDPDILHVDEAHLVSPESDTSYLKFITDIQQRKPFLKVVGWTATPYRLGLGHMTNGRIFTDMAFDITGMNDFNRLLAEGYLCPVIPHRTETVLDMGGVGMSGGDYNQAQAQTKIDKTEITFAALKEVVAAGRNRASWMIFAAGIEHAEHITAMLNNTFGIPTVCVHSKTDQMYGAGTRDRNIELFKTGQVRCIVNKDVLTTGFDHPPIDLIAVLRPTMSTGLWVQMLGRGTRPYDWQVTHDPVLRRFFQYKKWNCLVLDFANNTKKLGPINDPVIPKLRGEGPPGDSPIKLCPKCPAYVHASEKTCPSCGHVFVNDYIDPNIESTASTDDLIRGSDMQSDLPQVESFEVERVLYDDYYSHRSGKRSLKVTYYCKGVKTFWEYVAFEAPHKPFAIHKGHDWFRQRYSAGPCPEKTRDVYSLTPMFRIPTKILVWTNKPDSTGEIKNYDFGTNEA